MARKLVIVAMVALCASALSAQSRRNAPAPQPPPAFDAAAMLKDAANALGMLRTANRMDAINTMEFWGEGTSYAIGQAYKADGPWPAFKTQYHASLSYTDSAMRVEMVRNNPDGPGPIQGGGFLPLAAPQTLIAVVHGNYSWNESEVGAGLVPGKGVATLAPGTAQERQAQLWTLPYGAVKAAILAGDKARTTVENGTTVVTFPLSGELAGLTAKMTLDAKKLVTKVETRIDNPVLGDMNLEADYSDYGLFDEVQTDLMVPGHVVLKEGGFPVVDVKVTRSDTNNPYEIFPVPASVMQAASRPAAPKVDVAKVGEGVYYLTGETHHSVAVEFKNYVALVECPLGDDRANAVIAAVKRTIPNKPIKYVVNTHHHFDHSGGLRACAAEGPTILTQAENKPYYEKVMAMPHTIVPDSLAKAPKRTVAVEGVADKRVLSDGSQTLEIYRMQGSNHDSSMLIAYVPKAKLLIEADAYTPGAPNAAPPPPAKELIVLNDNVKRLNLDVQQVAPIHGRLVQGDEFRRAAGRASTN